MPNYFQDPKEYLPFLAELRRLEGSYQKFAIDKHLKRHEKALSHLAEAGSEYLDEFLEYMEEHGFYRYAAGLFVESDDRFRLVMRRFAEYLLAQSKYEAAGQVFERARFFEEAVEAFAKANAWREALTAASSVPFDAARRAELAEEMTGGGFDRR